LLFVGDDWAQDHHDVEIQDETGRRLAKARLPEGIPGIARLHGLVGRFLPEDGVALLISGGPGISNGYPAMAPLPWTGLKQSPGTGNGVNLMRQISP